MSETARTYRNIYVGGSLEDLKDQPGFESAEFDPNSEAAQNTSAFGKGAGPETYFIVVTGKKHNLAQDGQKFVGSTDLSLVLESLHPSQIIRELTETGSIGNYSEARTQMREQAIAEELGKKSGQDFPDVIGSGVPYEVQLDSPEAQPNSAAQREPTLPVDPMKYEGDTRSPALRALEKYLRSAAPDGPAPISAQGALLLRPYFLGQVSTVGDRSGNASGTPSPDTYPGLRRVSSAFPGMPPPDGDQAVPPPQPGRPLGIFTGKPMPLWTAPPPLGELLKNSNVVGNGDWFTALAGFALRNSTQPEPPQQTAGSMPERRLGRSTYSVSPASDTGALAAPSISSDADFPDGLLGRFAALAGIDSKPEPSQSDDEQEQADLQALEARLSSSGNIRDAVALYNARRY